MLCPACPAIAMAGGGLSGYFGFGRADLRKTAAVITSVMLGITTVALKVLLDIRLCDGNGNFSVRNIAQVGAMSLAIGLIYSVAVNYLLSRCVAPAEKSCCKKA